MEWNNNMCLVSKWKGTRSVIEMNWIKQLGDFHQFAFFWKQNQTNQKRKPTPITKSNPWLSDPFVVWLILISNLLKKLKSATQENIWKNVFTGLVPRDLFVNWQNAVSSLYVCLSALGRCQSCVEVAFYHLRLACQLRNTCQEQVAGVERWTSGMSGPMRSLAPGEAGWENKEGASAVDRGVVIKIYINIPVFSWTK